MWLKLSLKLVALLAKPYVSLLSNVKGMHKSAEILERLSYLGDQTRQLKKSLLP